MHKRGTHTALGHVAAIQQHVGIGRQCRPYERQLTRIGLAQAGLGDQGASQLQGASTAVGDDVHGVDVPHLAQHPGHLCQSVLPGLQDVDAARAGRQQRLNVGYAGVNEDDFTRLHQFGRGR